MLDQYSRNSVSIDQRFNYNINAVSGTLRKSHPKSKITKVPLDDPLLDKVSPKYTITKTKTIWSENSQGLNRPSTSYENTDHSVVILQVMLCGENMAVVEFVLEKDFDRSSTDEEGERHD